jgi:hypothetical protein
MGTCEDEQSALLEWCMACMAHILERSLLLVISAELRARGFRRRREYLIDMGIFRRKVPIHYIEIHPHNLGKNDWIIVLEAWTIIGPSPERLRIAKATTERKIVTKYNIFLRKRHFLVLEGYDPRIHSLFFCPQLYRYDSDHKLVPLEGEEIGQLLARSLQDGVVAQRPWYEPMDRLPGQPVVSPTLKAEFDSLVVESPLKRVSTTHAAQAAE